MEPTVPLKEYVDARDDAVESRLAAKLDTLATKSTIWAAVATMIGILTAFMAWGGDRFDGGVSVSPTIAALQADQAKRDNAQDAQMKSIDKKLDLVVKQTAK